MKTTTLRVTRNAIGVAGLEEKYRGRIVYSAKEVRTYVLSINSLQVWIAFAICPAIFSVSCSLKLPQPFSQLSAACVSLLSQSISSLSRMKLLPSPIPLLYRVRKTINLLFSCYKCSALIDAVALTVPIWDGPRLWQNQQFGNILLRTRYLRSLILILVAPRGAVKDPRPHSGGGLGAAWGLPGPPFPPSPCSFRRWSERGRRIRYVVVVVADLSYPFSQGETVEDGNGKRTR